MIDDKDLQCGDLEVPVAAAPEGVPVHSGGGFVRQAMVGDLAESVAAAPEGAPVHSGGGFVKQRATGN